MATSSETQLQIASLSLALRDESVIESDWSEALCTAPDVLVIMGESMVLASVPSAAQVRFTLQNLSATAPASLVDSTLPASLFECNQIGQRAFLKAHAGMTRIKMHASAVAPVINNIVRIFEQPGTAVTKKLLSMDLKKLESSSRICTKTSEEIQQEFTYWTEFTEALARAVVGKRDEVSNEKKEQNAKISEQDTAILIAKKKEERAEAALAVRQQKLNDAIRISKAAAESVDIAMSVSLSCAVGGAAPVAFAVMGTSLGAVYIADSNVTAAQEDIQKREYERIAAEDGRDKLVRSMMLLQHKEAKLEDIRKVLEGALKKLQRLQQNVNQLLLFFTEIHDYVDMLVTNTSGDEGLTAKILIPAELDLVERDEFLDQSIRLEAMDIKTRYIMMQKIAQAYSEVSKKYIVPGFSIVDRMAQSELNLSSDQVSERSRELRDYSENATEMIRGVVAQRQKELQDSVQLIVEQSAAGIIQRRIMNGGDVP